MAGQAPPVRAGAAAGAGPDATEALGAALREVRAALGGARPDLLLAFVGAAYADAADEIAAGLGELEPRVCAGVTVEGVVAGAAEIEHPQAVSLWALAVPGMAVEPLRFPEPGETAAEWPDVPPGTQALVTFADPFTFPSDAFLTWLAQHHADLPVVGGVASGGHQPGANRLLLDGVVHDDGAVAVALGGDIRVRSLVSQGCRPVGDAYVVTGAERNLVTELAGAPPVDRIREAYAAAGPDDQALMESGLHIGIAIDEYAETHERGDFLVRGILGAQQGTGAVAVGDLVRVGQTVRFQVRDAGSADEDLDVLLGTFDPGRPAGALLFTCNGRGTRLFDEPDHDAAAVQERLGDVPLAGFFAAGEFGPVGGRNHLHGFTASLLTVEPQP